jgi:hypothetical protein
MFDSDMPYLIGTDLHGQKKSKQMPSQKHFRIIFVSDVFSFWRHFAMTENAGFSCSRAKFFLINIGFP